MSPSTHSPANFGFNVKYLNDGRLQGSLVYVEHRPTGVVQLKSYLMETLKVDPNAATATFTGKATLDGVGPYNFTVTVGDFGEPGTRVPSTSDQFGLEVWETGVSGLIVVGDLTYANKVSLTDGNIQLPHQSKK